MEHAHDHEARLLRAEGSIREHDIAIAGITEVLRSVQQNQTRQTDALQRLVDRLEADEEATAAYRTGQAFSQGRDHNRWAMFGMGVVFLAGAVGSAVAGWFARLFQ
jgi:uncharacterized coiled-coil protein SlyX